MTARTVIHGDAIPARIVHPPIPQPGRPVSASPTRNEATPPPELRRTLERLKSLHRIVVTFRDEAARAAVMARLRGRAVGPDSFVGTQDEALTVRRWAGVTCVRICPAERRARS